MTTAIVKVLSIKIKKVQPNKHTKPTDKNPTKPPLDLTSLTYNVQRSAMPLFRQDTDPMSEMDRLMHACSDNMFPLALPSNVTEVKIGDFSPISLYLDGSPDSTGLSVATFCCEVCPHIDDMPYDAPYNSASSAGDFHIRLAAYLKNECSKSINAGLAASGYKPQYRYSIENPNYGNVMSNPQNEIMLKGLPNTNVNNTENEEKASPNMTVEWNADFGKRCERYQYAYTIMLYEWEESKYRSQSAIRIIVNDSEAMTPTEFKDFCTNFEEED